MFIVPLSSAMAGPPPDAASNVNKVYCLDKVLDAPAGILA
jgi:hypothetical protein